jgi:thioglycine synthase
MDGPSSFERDLLNSERTRFELDALPSVARVTVFGHSRTFEETDQLVRPLVKRIPITRIIDLTPLDSIGLPVWAAVTPLAHDLTVHSGKGTTDTASRLSAVMEAIERVSAERTHPSVTFEASYEDLLRTCRSVAPLDPMMFCLPFETQYSPSTSICWTIGYDIIDCRYRFIPQDLAISPARAHVCIGPETNGLAAGNTITEAVVHALYEIIERDALSVEYFCRMYADKSANYSVRRRIVDCSSLPPVANSLVAHLESRGLDLRVQNVTSTADVPTFRAILRDSAFPSSNQIATFEGSAADINSVRAITRAILEAVQAHSSLLLGARDSFEGMESRAARRAMLEREVEICFASDPEPLEAHACDGSINLLDDLHLLVRRLAADGVRHCIVVNLTDTELEVPVVRVVVPEFSGIYGETRRRPGVRLLRHLI